MFGNFFNKKLDQKDNWFLGEAKNTDTGSVSIFLKNLAPYIKSGDVNFSYVSYLTFHYEKDSKTGLPNPKDSTAFAEIEDADLLSFEKNRLSVHLASVTQEGIRDYIFQTSSPEKFLDLVELIKNKYPKYNVECEIIKDPEWRHYADLPGSNEKNKDAL